MYTLQGTNISHLGKGEPSTQKCRLVGDVLLPRRVYIYIYIDCHNFFYTTCILIPSTSPSFSPKKLPPPQESVRSKVKTSCNKAFSSKSNSAKRIVSGPGPCWSHEECCSLGPAPRFRLDGKGKNVCFFQKRLL